VEAVSLVEETLRLQKSVWKQTARRVAEIPFADISPEAPRRIILFGLGSSHFAARLVAHAMVADANRRRIPVLACSSMSIGHEILPSSGDLAIAFSHRGKPGPTMAALELFTRVGARTVLIGGDGAQVPKSIGTFVPTGPMERCEPHTMAVSGAVCAGTMLLLVGSAAGSVEDEWGWLATMPDPDLNVLRDRVKLGPQVLLGEWEGEWLAREGALKLMEMARLPVRTFGSEEFFHGPHFSHAQDASIWHVALPRDERAGQIQSSLTVRVAGASSLAWVPALIELQWAALGVALNRGVDPDGK